MVSRIILADDDPIMREMAEAKLVDAGYEVQVAENGEQAFQLLSTHGADLIVSDLDMPVMNGFELTEKIRATAALNETPVIVITASDQSDAVDKAFAAGATSFLSKPVNWSLFHQAVRFVLRASDDQKALRIARDQAEAGAKFKDSLMSVMSHELRTPLNAIIGFGQLIGDHFEKQNDTLYHEYADYIVDGGKRLLNSVSDMLLASDARSGPIKINESDITVGDIIEEVKSLTQKSRDASKARLTVHVQNENVEVRCDNVLIARALAKLVDNSIKFSPEGVNIVLGAAQTKDGGIAFLVKDNGPGITAEKLQEVATPFTQSDMSIRRSKEGLGLGVPLVQAISIAHQARFKLDSTLGEGARALLVLPPDRVNALTKVATQVA